MRTGATVLELLVVLGLMGLLVALAGTAVGAAADRIAVRSAQNALAHWIGVARHTARATGGARLRVELDSSRVVLLPPAGASEVLSLGREFGVRIDASGSRTPELRFDAMGVGRFASRTFHLARGSAARSVVVSSYGRVARR